MEICIHYTCNMYTFIEYGNAKLFIQIAVPIKYIWNAIKIEASELQ